MISTELKKLAVSLLLGLKRDLFGYVALISDCWLDCLVLHPSTPLHISN